MAGGNFSFASGRNAKVAVGHNGTFLYVDSQGVGFNSVSNNEFAVRATGGVRFVSAIDAPRNPTAGVVLDPGGGSWSSLSNREAKTNFQPIDGTEVLAKLSEIPIENWSYKSQDASIRHIGPMAQDLHAAFGVGESEEYISNVDADGISFAAIQALHKLVTAQQAQIEGIEARLDALEQASGIDTADSDGALPMSLPLGGLALIGVLTLGAFIARFAFAGVRR